MPIICPHCKGEVPVDTKTLGSLLRSKRKNKPTRQFMIEIGRKAVEAKKNKLK